ncbi:MAG: hypothetical protein MUC36_26825 [Planctomycetes bacterium]|jgi:hypothetical protein|nr:hypothetical protein [Planctomycetota bacterium]
MKRWHAPVVVFTCLGLGFAQGGDAERAQAEIARARRQLQQARGETERLHDLRLRHDLGLPGDDGERTFKPTAPADTETMERMHQELRDQDAQTATILERYNKLRAAVDQLRADAEARAQREAAERPSFTVPTAGSAQPTPIDSPVRSTESPPAPVANPAPAGETVRATTMEPVAVSSLDPMRATITGSTDHQRVAQALFRAGQALLERGAAAREQAQLTIAKDLDDRGKEKLQRALDELAPLLKAKEPPFEALFYQGRCLELLFRHAELHDGLSMVTRARDYQKREQEVRDPFLRITARDVRKTGQRNEVEVLGPWGMAAQAAMEHFRWMNLNASYDATAAIQALTWPGEKDR